MMLSTFLCASWPSYVFSGEMVQMNLFTEQEYRHRHRELTCRPGGEGEGEGEL